jgi:poly(3-hydroxyalkanoate) synthetase
MALCGALNSVEVIRPRSGHIGMVVGQRAARELWEPLGRWLKDLKS